MIENPIQTRRALLVWQTPLDQGGSRNRRAVAELVQQEEFVSFRYFSGEHIGKAHEAGFRSYPGLPIAADYLNEIAMEVLIHRLPPRNRGDFNQILKNYGLPEDGKYTDLSLLAYTGARLTSDTFSICETFEGFAPPFSYVFDVAGYRRHRRETGEVETGDPVRFVRERNNPEDENAVRINRADGSKVGYVNRLQAEKVGEWLDEGSVNATVLRINGRIQYPRMFVLAEISGARESEKA